MDLNLGDEQVMLRDSVTRFLREESSFDTRRARSRTENGYDPAIWRAFAEVLGVLGATFPENVGGMGGGAVEAMIISEALGASLVIEPYLETVIIAGGVLKRAGGDRAAEMLRSISDGSRRIVPAFFEANSRYDASRIETIARRDGDGWIIDGTKAVVVGAPHADMLLVTARTDAGLSMFAIASAAVARHDYRLIDDRPAADLILTGVRVPGDALIGEDGGALPLVEAAMEEGIAALCAEAVGVMRRMLDDTVAYTRDRKQFGQPLSSFQVLQHRMVDMLIAVEQSVAASYLATLNLSSDPATRARAIAAAKVTVGDALRFVGQNAVQLHGGMGMTEELAVGHYFKRATVIEQQFGPPDLHVARYATLMRDAA